MRPLVRTVRALAWGLLSAAALAGVLVSAAVVVASSSVGRPLVADALVRLVNAEVAGHLELGSVRVLPGGGLELEGFRATDPSGRVVLAVERARLFADVTRLRNRVIGVTAELEGPAVLLAEEEGGGLSLARTFAPAPARTAAPRRSAPPPARAPAPGHGLGWTLRVQRLEIREGAVRWLDPGGQVRLQASRLVLAARGVIGPARSVAELSLHGTLERPTAVPITLDLRGSLAGAALRLPVLRARLGSSSLVAAGEADLAARTGRVALARLALDRAQARALVPEAPPGDDVELSGFGLADGRIATVALHVAPRSPAHEGRADVALAARLDGARALGLSAVLDRFDPAAVDATLPAGRITLTAHGAVAGDALRTTRGRLELTLSRSRLRGGEVGPGEAVARIEPGAWEVQRLSLSAPGIAIEGSGRWKEGGPVGGKVDATVGDLSRALANVSSLLGEKVPELAGHGRIGASLAGTTAAPTADATVDAPAFAAGNIELGGVRGEVHLSGWPRAPEGHVDATAERVVTGGEEWARALFLRATLAAGGEGQLSASALVPGLGRDPVTLAARGRRTPDWARVEVSELTLGYPGTRYALREPATVSLDGPRVDRLELEGGGQRLVLEGGLARSGVLDAHLVLAGVRLEGLPAGLLPAGIGIGGTVSADLRASGEPAAATVKGNLSVSGGAVHGLAGLTALADLRFDGAARRAAVALAVTRAGGGSVDLRADVPVPLQGRPGAPLEATLRAEEVPLEAVLRAAGLDLPASGSASGAAELSGAVGAPALRLSASLTGGVYDELSGISLSLRADVPGVRMEAHAEAGLGGRRTLVADASLPLDLADLLARPGEALRGLAAAKVTGDVQLSELDLSALSGRLGIPEELAGKVSGTAHLEGPPLAPRGGATLELSEGAALGVSRIGARVEVTAAADRLAVAVRGAVAGEEVLSVRGALGAPPERLARGEGLRRAPLQLEATVPSAALSHATEAGLPVSGAVEARLTASGTLAALQGSLEASGTGMVLDGRPLGNARLKARWEGSRGTAAVELAPAAGGTLAASVAVEAPLGLGTSGEALRAAPAEATVRAQALDLGVLSALAPSLFREAAGKLEADVSARGPLARLTPRGTLRVERGAVAVAELGEWTGIAIGLKVSEDAVELEKLSARRSEGTLEAHGALRGIASGKGKLEGGLEAHGLSLVRAGTEVARVEELVVRASGSSRPGALDATLTVDRGTIHLPRQTPRKLQSIDRRVDIVVGRPPRKGANAAAPGAGEKPYAITLRLLVPTKVSVVGSKPRLQLDLKADVTYEHGAEGDLVTGTVEVVRGFVEPINGRTFLVQNGKVTFSGGPPKAAMLDVKAVYENPAATVTVAVAGPLTKPEVHMSSQPALDDSQIALLIATGRTDIKPASSGGNQALTGQDVGNAALAALSTQAFQDLVSNRLPVDTVSLDPSQLRAGKVVNDKVYVGYIRRFDARPELGENTNEVRLEYRIGKGWNFESRYGDANTGGASLVWTKDY